MPAAWDRRKAGWEAGKPSAVSGVYAERGYIVFSVETNGQRQLLLPVENRELVILNKNTPQISEINMYT